MRADVSVSMGVDVLCIIPTQSPELVREREEKEKKRRISMDQKLLLKSIIKVRLLSAEMIDRSDTLLPTILTPPQL